MMPLEALTSEQVLSIVDLAMREFGTVFVDLPTNWTNWSLSLLARSDLVLLVTEIASPSLHRARRQLDLIASQDLGNSTCGSSSTRSRRACSRRSSRPTSREVLGRDIAFTIANDHATMSAAIDRGVPIDGDQAQERAWPATST